MITNTWHYDDNCKIDQLWTKLNTYHVSNWCQDKSPSGQKSDQNKKSDLCPPAQETKNVLPELTQETKKVLAEPTQETKIKLPELTQETEKALPELAQE